MSKAFTKESEGEEDDGPEETDALPADVKNYMTPEGAAAMQAEFKQLSKVERPKIVEVVAWAAGNGDRSENGDYIYGKKRLREIDRRLRYLEKRMQSTVIVDPKDQQGLEKVFFGATVTYAREGSGEQTVRLVGLDEANVDLGKISWLSPVAKALLKSSAGDTVQLRTPSSVETLEVIEVRYPL